MQHCAQRTCHHPQSDDAHSACTIQCQSRPKLSLSCRDHNQLRTVCRQKYTTSGSGQFDTILPSYTAALRSLHWSVGILLKVVHNNVFGGFACPSPGRSHKSPPCTHTTQLAAGRVGLLARLDAAMPAVHGCMGSSRVQFHVGGHMLGQTPAAQLPPRPQPPQALGRHLAAHLVHTPRSHPLLLVRAG